MGVAGLGASPVAGSGWLGKWQVTNRLSGDQQARQVGVESSNGRAVTGGQVCCVCYPPGSLGREAWGPFLCLPGRWSLGEGLLLVWEPGWRLMRPLLPGQVSVGLMKGLKRLARLTGCETQA